MAAPCVAETAAMLRSLTGLWEDPNNEMQSLGPRAFIYCSAGRTEEAPVAEVKCEQPDRKYTAIDWKSKEPFVRGASE
ncbi:hypothetical protein C2845_PM17G08940 [Panicum miliaceum]|uniref:Uncharacterized protein n=1 Tax=Panicum miliaceum TaxID=4540 RepID=A0A3L6Q1B7_PANMI|nr:hypothetical protein C2845_PM17G08940 [Panicum miliaceum]